MKIKNIKNKPNKTERIKYIALAVICFSVVAMEIVAVILSAIEEGWELFKFYTQNSNIFTGVSSGILGTFAILKILKNKDIPQWCLLIYYTSTCTVTITFLIVTSIAIPFMNFGFAELMLINQGLFMHFICPVIVIPTFIILSDDLHFGAKQAVFPTVFSFIYGIVIIPLVGSNIITAPYPILNVNQQPLWLTLLWFIICVCISYIISISVAFCNHKFNIKKLSKKNLRKKSSKRI